MAKCVLEIRDEVNVKFVGLAPSTRRKISDEAKYFLPYAYHMPAYKLGRWDGCVRYCDIGGRTYMNILDKLIPIVQADGYEIEIDDKRQSTILIFLLLLIQDMKTQCVPVIVEGES